MDDCAIDQPRRKKLSVGLPLFNFLCSGDHVLELYAGGELAPTGKGLQLIFDELPLVIRDGNPDLSIIDVIVQTVDPLLGRGLIVQMANHAGDQMAGDIKSLPHQDRAEPGNTEEQQKAEEEDDDGEFNERQPVLSPDDLNSRCHHHFPVRRSPQI